VLREPANRYLVRHLCWVLTIEGLDAYILVPRVSEDLDLLVDALRPAPSGQDVDVVIGLRGPLAGPDRCNGLVVPMLVFDQVYSFDRDALVAAIPKPDSVPKAQEAQFRANARDLFDQMIQVTDNLGATDEHRALNYVAVRYDRVYAIATELSGRNFSSTGVDVRRSRLSGARTIVDVIFTFTHRQTDVTEKYYLRVDVTEEFPFLVTKLSPFYDR
jgi:hypothetical protein